MKVLVTGANGFIAAHCISALLAQSISVRATVRSPAKATATKDALINAGLTDLTGLELVVVADPTDLGQFSPAVAGCDAILHLASAFSYDAKKGEFEEKLLIPALKGTTTVCEAAAKEKSVKKVVVMSSFAAVYDAAKGLSPGTIYTERDWSPLTYEEGRDAEIVPTAYRASKVIAEKAAWDYIRDHEVQYQLVTLCPGMVFGKMIHPIETLATLNASNQIVWDVLSGDAIPPTKAPVWIDVQDLAETSVKAITTPLATHERFLVTEGPYDTQAIADVVREALPQFKDRIPVGVPGERIRETHYGCDAGKVKAMLGVEFRGLRESIVPLAEQLFSFK